MRGITEYIGIHDIIKAVRLTMFVYIQLKY